MPKLSKSTDEVDKSLNHLSALKPMQTASSSGSFDLLPFKEALDLAKGAGKKHLMLGNGFSIALFRNIFSYNTLLERAKESKKLSNELAEVFDKLGTTDFEQVMEALQNAAELVSHYEKSNPSLAARLKQDAARLRDILAETISENHPDRPHAVKTDQYSSCRQFLSNFDGCIYTLNYDLLLYWTLMQSEVAPDVESDDGFRDPETHDQDYVVWDVQNTNEQRIFYLHGALHIYDAGAELLKFTWSKTDIPLVEQIRKSLGERRYPLIVTEGTSSQKKDRIQHSNFLGRAYRSFAAIKGSLFVYGHSLAENDEHLLKLIDKGKTSKVFVGIYGDPSTDLNKKIIDRARQMSLRRPPKGPQLDIHFFDASTAHVWDSQGFDDAKAHPGQNRRKG